MFFTKSVIEAITNGPMWPELNAMFNQLFLKCIFNTTINVLFYVSIKYLGLIQI